MNNKDTISAAVSCINIINSKEMLLGGNRTSDVESAVEFLTRIELDLAYSSEKLLNLEILLMHIANRFSDDDVLMLETRAVSPNWMKKSFELDMLLGILDSEVTELSLFMNFLQQVIVQAFKKIPLAEQLDIPLEKIEEKLHDAKESLNQSWNQISDIKVQSAKFERILSFGGEENCDVGTQFYGNIQGRTHTVEQQRHALRMLEKSLARELDLDKRWLEARHNEEECKLKLHYVEGELFCMEEAMKMNFEKLFVAENTAEVLMGNSKELIGKLHQAQLDLKGALHHENEMKYKVEVNEMILASKELELSKLRSSIEDFERKQNLENELKSSLEVTKDKEITTNKEVLQLKELVTLLEKQLQASDTQLQQERFLISEHEGKQYIWKEELAGRDNEILVLKQTIERAKCRLEVAEAECSSLDKLNFKLNEELFLLRASEEQKSVLLERKFNESNDYLEHAKSSVDVIQREQIILCSTMNDMENVIEDLKVKISQAERRSEAAESNCTLLTNANSQLNEEILSLKLRTQSLEETLQQSNTAKATAVKEIGIKTRVITNLVMKLASERERVQMQLHAMKKENKILVENTRMTDQNGQDIVTGNGKKTELSEGVASEPSVVNSKAHDSFSNSSTVQRAGAISASVVNDRGKHKLELVRTIDVMQLSSKQLALAFMALLMSGLALYLLRLEQCPF